MNKFLKRLFDIIFSGLALIAFSPLFLILAIWIKSDSHGPVFFVQERLGKNAEVFKIIKFRTMVINAENIGDGLSVKTDKDSRITKSGRLLRKTSLDELPQLINVFLGQMSIVGPRPPVTYHPYGGIENYPGWALKRFEMRPGITGLAQVRYRNSKTWEERFQVDVEYIKEFSILLDIKILLATLKRVFKSDNIYG
jgi:undecaprenyl phosphate N,N'-diacetylbacillosamine 1-phosphate transferase